MHQNIRLSLLRKALSTSAVKAALFDFSGQLAALSTQEYTLDKPRAGILEIDPES